MRNESLYATKYMPFYSKDVIKRNLLPRKEDRVILILITFNRKRLKRGKAKLRSLDITLTMCVCQLRPTN